MFQIYHAISLIEILHSPQYDLVGTEANNTNNMQTKRKYEAFQTYPMMDILLTNDTSW